MIRGKGVWVETQVEVIVNVQVMDTTKKEAKSRYIKKESDPTRAEVE